MVLACNGGSPSPKGTPPAPASSEATFPLDVGGITLPPTSTPLAGLSSDMRTLVEEFRALAQAKVPRDAPNADQQTEPTAVISGRKAWIDSEVTPWARTCAEHIQHMRELRKNIDASRPMEVVLASALVGTAEAVFRKDWDTVQYHTAGWLKQDSANPAMRPYDAEIHAYWNERAESIDVPADAVIAQSLKTCADAASSGSNSSVMLQWKAFCSERFR